jgi:hypothetical protein
MSKDVVLGGKRVRQKRIEVQLCFYFKDEGYQLKHQKSPSSNYQHPLVSPLYHTLYSALIPLHFAS